MTSSSFPRVAFVSEALAGAVPVSLVLFWNTPQVESRWSAPTLQQSPGLLPFSRTGPHGDRDCLIRTDGVGQPQILLFGRAQFIGPICVVMQNRIHDRIGIIDVTDADAVPQLVIEDWHAQIRVSFINGDDNHEYIAVNVRKLRQADCVGTKESGRTKLDKQLALFGMLNGSQATGRSRQ